MGNRFRDVRSFCNLWGIPSAVVPRSLSNFTTIRYCQHPMSRFWNLELTSNHLGNRDPMVGTTESDFSGRYFSPLFMCLQKQLLNITFIFDRRLFAAVAPNKHECDLSDISANFDEEVNRRGSSIPHPRWTTTSLPIPFQKWNDSGRLEDTEEYEWRTETDMGAVFF